MLTFPLWGRKAKLLSTSLSFLLRAAEAIRAALEGIFPYCALSTSGTTAIYPHLARTRSPEMQTWHIQRLLRGRKEGGEMGTAAENNKNPPGRLDFT